MFVYKNCNFSGFLSSPYIPTGFINKSIDLAANGAAKITHGLLEVSGLANINRAARHCRDYNWRKAGEEAGIASLKLTISAAVVMTILYQAGFFSTEEQNLTSAPDLTTTFVNLPENGFLSEVEDLTIDVETPPECIDVMETIKSCPAASSLLDEANQVLGQKGLSPVRFVDVNWYEIPASARANCLEGKILVRNYIEGMEKVTKTIFELSNIKRCGEFETIARHRWLGFYLYPEDAAEAAEKVEYESVKEHAEVIQKCIQSNGWSKEVDLFSRLLQESWSSFKGYYTSMQRSGHSENYMR